MILYCVRHGESVYNAEHRIQGQIDIPLSSRGQLQSAALAVLLAQYPIDAIFASPLQRAMQTALPIADRLGLEIRTDARLMEIHAGIFQGLQWDEIEASHPADAARWIAQEPDFVIPEGESRRALMQRGREVFESIRATGFGHVLVVAHGGVLTAALKSLLDIPAERRPFSLYNAALTRANWQKEFLLLSLNETHHLREINDARAEQGGDL